MGQLLKLLGLIAVGAVLFAIVFRDTCGVDNQSGWEARGKHITSESEAYDALCRYVKGTQLRYPESADFASFFSAQIQRRSDSSLFIRSSVTAANAFGVKSKYIFEAVVTETPENWEFEHFYMYAARY